MVCLQAAIAIMALAPQSYGGVAYDSVRIAIRAKNADGLRCLLAFSIPVTDGRLQSILIGRLTAFRAGAGPYIPVLVKVLLDPKSKNRSDVAIDLG